MREYLNYPVNNEKRAEREDPEKVMLEKAMEKIKSTEGSLNEIDMNRFEDLYEKKFIDIDLEYVKDKEEEFEEERIPEKEKEEMRGKIMEAITIFYLSRWLGENVAVRKSSRYDDIRNKVDAIVEIDEETKKEILALAVDVTHINFSGANKNLIKKLSLIKKEVSAGKLSMIKYYESNDGVSRKKLTQIPRVIIGVDRETLSEITNLWISEEENKLENHPIQFQIIDEIIMQLQTYISYAEKIGQGKVAEIFKRQLKILEKILDNKSKNDDLDQNYRQKDQAFLAMKKCLENFESLK